jgi:phosphoheptose isomerase
MLPTEALRIELQAHTLVLQKNPEHCGSAIVQIALEILHCFERGNKLMLCGNGGSAADAQQIAAEFINRFRFDHPPLPALALTTDPSVVTSIGNDSDFACIFRDKWKPLRSLAICSQPSVPADALPMC